jgi:hypothetical protein
MFRTRSDMLPRSAGTQPGRTARGASEEPMYEGLDTVAIHNELAYHDVLPVRWEPLMRTLNPFEVSGMDESNVMLLQACVAVEEQPTRDKNEELHPLASELARIDFKLNLVLKLVGQLVDSRQAIEPVPIQFNRQGATWQGRGVLPPLGSHGILHIGLRASLTQSLDFVAQISENEQGAVSAEFTQVAPQVADLIQQLCFLKHRKRVAGSRISRNR